MCDMRKEFASLEDQDDMRPPADSIILDRSQKRYEDVVDVCNELTVIHGSARSALAMIVKESKTFKATLRTLRKRRKPKRREPR